MNEFLTKDVRKAQELKDQDEYTRLKNLSDTVSDYTAPDTKLKIVSRRVVVKKLLDHLFGSDK